MKELALQREAAEWAPPTDLNIIPLAGENDIPLLDLSRYCAALVAVRSEAGEGGGEASLELEKACVEVGRQLREAGEGTGFFYLRNFEDLLSASQISRAFDATKNFHALPEEVKMEYAMDGPGMGCGGVGYLPVKNHKLPKRERANMNGTFIIKRELGPRDITLDRMPWPRSTRDFDGAEFRKVVTETCDALEGLSHALLPLYAEALRLPPDFFAPAFISPLYRFRMSKYPPTPPGELGINPHLDTSFFTLLPTTDASGLVVFSHARGEWVRARHVEGTLIVNTGETLSRITNDTWPATRHYAINPGIGSADRYSIPFFFNPSAAFPMAVVPSCCSDSNPPKYQPVSYLDGQGVAQGE